MCLKCSLNLKLAYKIQQNMLNAEQRFRAQILASVKQEIDVPQNGKIKTEQLSDEELPKTSATQPESTKSLKEKQSEYVCDVCGKKFPALSAIKQHKNNAHVKLECPICKKKVTKYSYSHHFRGHTDSFTMCELCGMVVKKVNFLYHVKAKHKEQSYKCGYCDEVFKRTFTRNMHEKKVHLGA